MGSLADALIASINAGHMAWPLMLAFLAGFLTALSPCVYPLVPITLSIMGARQYHSHLHGFLVASSYVLGMTLVYAALGVIFSSIGLLLGSIMQNPVTLVVLAVLFALMALSIFGVLPVVIPSKWLEVIAKIGGSGFKGAFLMGMVAGLVAAPCTGPVLAFILAIIAEKQDLGRGLLLMILFSLGLGVPFLALGTFSSAVAHLPKSGRWMNSIKILMGFAMLATSFYYVYLAWPKNVPAVEISALKWHIIDARSSVRQFDDLLKQASQQKRAVLIDFYASWCTACIELDEVTYKDERVIKALKPFLLIKVDATNSAPLLTTIHQRFKVTGLPTTVIFNPDQREAPRSFFGFMRPEKFLNILPNL